MQYSCGLARCLGILLGQFWQSACTSMADLEVDEHCIASVFKGHLADSKQDLEARFLRWSTLGHSYCKYRGYQNPTSTV